MPKFAVNNLIDLAGTYLQGYISARPSQMMMLLGKPVDHSPFAPAMWVMRFEDGAPASVYSRAPLTRDDSVMIFHIGGFQRAVVPMVHQAFRERFGLMGQAQSKG